MAQQYDPQPPWPDRQETQHTGPVFADPSGQRRRLMRVIGAAGSMVLIGALIIAGIGLFGGPNTPFSVFGAPARGTGADGNGGHRSPAPGSASSMPGAPGSSAPARSGKPSASPSTSPDHSPTPTPSGSPTPTNPAGRTPPGQGRSKTPHPSPSSSHGR